MKPPRAATPAPPRGALRVLVYILCIPELYRRVFIFNGMVTGMATAQQAIITNDAGDLR